MQNLCALRGLDMIARAGLAATIGDPSHFASASDFMSYLGLVPSEHSSGPKRRLGAVTKTGDVDARTLPDRGCTQLLFAGPRRPPQGGRR